MERVTSGSNLFETRCTLHVARCTNARLSLPLRLGVPVAVGVAVLLVGAAPAEAALLRGLAEIVTGVLQIPISTLVGTFSGPPVVGTVFGALPGAVQGVSLVARGALDVASSGVSIAMKAAPYVLPFLL